MSSDIIENRKSIILMCVYMGQLPYWIPAFMISCERNPDIEWLIVTNVDKSSLPEPPNNVRFLYLNLKQFNEKVSDSLGLSANIKAEFAYKICDYKVAFGKIFSDELKGYDFWGFCDLDIVWGNIRRFITHDILNQHQVISSREKCISGHFCLFQNSPHINTMFEDIPKVRKMMVAEKNYVIDEEYLTYYLNMVHKPNLVFWVKNFYNFRNLVKPDVYWDRDLTTSGACQRALHEGINKSFLWKNGCVFDSEGQELMYIHFHKIKHAMDRIDFSYTDDVDKFIINREGIFVS